LLPNKLSPARETPETNKELATSRLDTVFNLLIVIFYFCLQVDGAGCLVSNTAMLKVGGAEIKRFICFSENSDLLIGVNSN